MKSPSRNLPAIFLLVIAIHVLVPAPASFAYDPPAAASPGTVSVRVLRSKRIWDAAPHNAFTDLARWQDRWYCSFREATGHSSYDGAVRVLSSSDGEKWQSVAHFADEGVDLRDPKLCVLPDGRLLVGIGARRQDERDAKNWHTRSRVMITSDGKTWESHVVGDPQVWMWRYVTHGDYVYSWGYRQRPKGMGGETFLRFYRSRDGVTWDKIVQSEAGGGYVNEAAFAFEPDGQCVTLLRREGGNNRLGLSLPPYTDWTWTDLQERFNGPALLRLHDGRILAGGRSKALGASLPKTTIGWLTTDPPALNPELWLPSQHETGYPGLAFHDGRIWASYYSSESGKCAIYIAQLELADRQ
jgi:hypothetical protein